MRISNSQLQNHGVNGIVDQTVLLTKLQQQISSGKKILEPSDDPVGATNILAINQQLFANDQYLKNVNKATSALEFEESTLKTADDILARVRELVISAGSGVLTSDTRGFIVSEIEQRLDQLVDLANTKAANGEYIFSGFKGLGITVSQNAQGEYVYGGDEGQRYISVGSTSSVPINDTAKDIFFQLPSEKILANTSTGIASSNATTSGLQITASSAFYGITLGQLTLNGTAVPPAVSDGVSTSLASASALASVNAINSGTGTHGVTATVQANVINMGIATPGSLSSGAFSINSQPIISALGTEADIINQINLVTATTGVVATMPGGAGTAITLTAADGRNIAITTGSTFNTFTVGANVNKIQRAGIDLSSGGNYIIAGTNPAVIGLTAGTVASSSTTNSGLITAVSSPAFSGLTVNQLRLNNIAVPAATGDGVSTALSSTSALASANAINQGSLLHGVRASPLANVIDLGTITTGNLNSGDFSINGQPILSALGTEADIIKQINLLTTTTGIVASQPSGAGTAVILTAADGRNIQLTSGANFTTFGIGANVDKVQRAGLKVFADDSFIIGGSNPGVIGLTPGTISITDNSGTGSASAKVIGEQSSLTIPYSIRFTSTNTYSIYADNDPNTPLSGFSNLSYTPGANIDFNNIRVVINGAPASGDRFNINLEQQSQQDVFTTLKNLINDIKNDGSEPKVLSYELGLALKNLDIADTRVLQVRSKIGARLNVLDTQKYVLGDFNVLFRQNLSDTQDLDFTKAISDLTQQQFLLEASQKSFVRVQSLSLFNFLR
jgi:flagellar hook-associated protein 3 FlgL